MKLTSSDLPVITGGKWLQNFSEREIKFLSTDSRKTVFNPSCLFFAIGGNNHDGHSFIADLYTDHVRQFVIEDPEFDISSFPEGNFLVCNNSIEALQKLVIHHREQLDPRTIGITGSNGKTIVKEWLSQFLSWKYNVIKTPKSYNSQIGVPLSVWLIRDYHEIAIFEAGISKTGEMEKLQPVIKPDIGIFTNIGPAHDEGFISREEKIREKLLLFKNSGKLIYNIDDPLIHSSIEKHLPEIEKLSWGNKNDALLKIEHHFNKAQESYLSVLFKKNKYIFHIPFSDKASVENISHCIVYLIYIGWTENAIQDVLDDVSRISMRLVLKKGINDCYLIDDSYSNDLSSLEIALNYLKNQNQRAKKSIILTDILQSGLSENVLNNKIAELLNRQVLDKIIVIGEHVRNLKSLSDDSSFFQFNDTDEFLKKFNQNDFNSEIILIKGARKFGLEKVANQLQEKLHGTILEINLDAISHNLNIYRSYLNPDTKIMVMVKALAYGSGSVEVANLLQFHRVDYLGVAYTDEGITLRKNGISLPIMVMNPDIETLEKITEFRLEPEIYNIRLLREIDRWTKEHRTNLKIHLKFDTGMHRLGFVPSDMNEIIRILGSNKYLTLNSIFSHLAGADDPDHDIFTHAQAGQFEKAIKTLRESLKRNFLVHLANSAAIIRFPEYQFDMVRLGIGIYGTDATGMIADKLLPIGTLKTTVSHIMDLKKNESIGYGRKGRLTKDSRIATIAIGYADGFSRSFSNGIGKVIVNGQMAPVIGNVCMDMTMIDVTGLDTKEGDEVIIFGHSLPLTELAGSINTIPYEILTSVSERVKRIYISE